MFMPAELLRFPALQRPNPASVLKDLTPGPFPRREGEKGKELDFIHVQVTKRVFETQLRQIPKRIKSGGESLRVACGPLWDLSGIFHG